MNKFTKIAIAGFAAVVGFQAPQADAGIVTHSVSIGPANLDWTAGTNAQTALIPQFNPALHGGALPSQMIMSFEGSLSPIEDVFIRNFSTASSTNASIDGEWNFSVTGPGGIPNFTFDTSIVAGGIAVAGASDSSSATFTDTIVVSAGTLFPFTGGPSIFAPTPASFIGPGLVTVTATNTAVIGFDGLATSAAFVSWFMQAEGILTVSYIVPAPAGLLLLGFGMIGAGLMRRRTQA